MTSFLMLHTKGGTNYARRIGHELRGLGEHYYLATVFNNEIVYNKHKDEDLIIHPRIAYPFPQHSAWMNWLFALSKRIPVINLPSTLALTSNKYKCAKTLIAAGIPINNVVKVPEDVNLEEFYKDNFDDSMYVIKPLISKGKGERVYKFNGNNDYQSFKLGYKFQEDNLCFVQKFFPVLSLYRVILVNNKPFRHVFVDDVHNGDDWKLSVCLNKNMHSMKLDKVNPKVIDVAIKAQQVVSGYINFVDVYEDEQGEVSISEINTSCNLSIHEKISDSNIAKFIAEGLVEYAQNR